MQNININKAENRILYFDFLRIFATIGVMILHVSASNWYVTNVRSFEWQVFNAGESIVRWSVPIFVMISGALFLDRDTSIVTIYKKNILRIITAFIFWSIIYELVEFEPGTNIKGFGFAIISGHYHMWFLYMIVGLYMIVPFVRKIVESQLLIKYFLAVALLFTFFIPQIINAISWVNEDLANNIYMTVDKMNFHFTLGYICYFVLGYYLCKIDITKKVRIIIYILSICGFAFTIGATSFVSIYKNEHIEALYGNFTINVLLESLGVFVFFKYIVGSINICGRIKNIVLKLSKYSFGAYLVHALIIEELSNICEINTLMFNPILAIIIITIIVFVISFAISFICNNIPFLKRYIV